MRLRARGPVSGMFRYMRAFPKLVYRVGSIAFNNQDTRQ